MALPGYAETLLRTALALSAERAKSGRLEAEVARLRERLDIEIAHRRRLALDLGEAELRAALAEWVE